MIYKKSIFTYFLFVSIFFALFLMPNTVWAVEDDSEALCTRYLGSNINNQNYSRGYWPVKSYLVKNNEGFMRVQANSGDCWAVVSYYDDELNLTDRKELSEELPYWGAFHETESNYYVVSGNINHDESDEVEVLRITKYDKNWNRLDSCSLFGANSRDFFAAGCRVDIDGSYMVIRTSHRIYALEGTVHQTNATIQVDIDNMTISDYHVKPAGSYDGYVSHSFNQFVKIEDDHMITVDQGDAFPRALVLIKHKANVSKGTFQNDDVEKYSFMSFPGGTGVNDTGVSVGGFEISNSSYLCAGNCVKLDENYLEYNTRNVFIASIDKKTKSSIVRQLTGYEEGEESTTTPHLVKINDNNFFMLWSRGRQFYYVFLDGEGKKTSEIMSKDGYISDCVPVVSNNSVIWYTWHNEDEVFYSVPIDEPENITVKSVKYQHDYDVLEVNNGIADVKCKKCGKETKALVPTSVYSSWRQNNGWSSNSPDRYEVGQETEYMAGVRYNESTDITEKLLDYVVELEDPDAGVVYPIENRILWKKPGDHKVNFYSKYVPEISNTYTVTVLKDLESVSITSRQQSPQKYNNRIALDAKPDGGRGRINYQFIAKKAGEDEKIIRDFSTDSNCIWLPDSFGEYELKVIAKDTKDNIIVTSDTITFTIEKADVEKEYIHTGVCVTYEADYGIKTGDLEFKSDKFVDSITRDVVTGCLEWVNPEEIPDAGSNVYLAWRFIPDNENYNVLIGKHQIRIKKLEPNIDTLPVIDEIVYNPNITLADINLFNDKNNSPGTWSWEDDSIVPTTNDKKFQVIFTPDDKNYYTKRKDLTVTIKKATPFIVEKNASDIVYGESLGDSNLTSKVVYSENDDTEVKGALSWSYFDKKIKPEVKDSNTTIYKVYFQPEDSNYERIETTITLNIKKALLSNVPSGLINVSSSVKTIKNSILSGYSYWRFNDDDLDKPIQQEKEEEFTVYYSGTDADNYSNTTSTVSILRSKCDHIYTETKNACSATCETDGYTGDVYCLNCDELLEKGNIIEHLEHDYGGWKGVNEDNHYRICNNNENHYDIEAHSWDEGTVLSPATAYQDGIITYTCSICGFTKYTFIPRLNDSEITPTNSPSNIYPTQPVIRPYVYPTIYPTVQPTIVPKRYITEDNEDVQEDDQEDNILLVDMEEQIAALPDDGEINGSDYSSLKLKEKKVGKNYISLNWNKVPDASSYIIYGNKCGKNSIYKKIISVPGNKTSYKIKKLMNGQKLKKGTYYKFLVVAIHEDEEGESRTIATSKSVHIVTQGSKFANYSSVKIKSKKNITLNIGNSNIIKYKLIKKGGTKAKQHRKIKFESTDLGVVTVSDKGRIKAVGKGIAKIYVYTQNGKSQVINVSVD